MGMNKLGYSEQIYEILRRRIITLQLAPGERIDIGKLSREFNISATPVREALRGLVERGLVHYKKDVGYWVVSLTRKDVEDIFALRKLLECFALEKGIDRIPTEKLDELRDRSLYLLEDNLSPTALRQEFDKTDECLHRELIIGSCNNKFIKMMYSYVNDYIAIVRHLNERIKEAVKEHLCILDAIQEANLEKAETELSRHLDNSARECPPVPCTTKGWKAVVSMKD